MKEKLHRIFSCLMALFLLASTTSWTVGKHYCMGRLMNVSLFAHAEDCGMAMSDVISDDTHEEDSCCDNETVVVDGLDDLKISFSDFNLDQQLFLVTFTYSYFALLQVQTERPVPNEHYPPPLLIKNIQLLDEVFLI